MAGQPGHDIQVAHAMPGRIRLRLPWLRRRASVAAPLADALAALPGVIDVAVRVRTGSVLCRYNPDRLTEDRVMGVVDLHIRATQRDRAGRNGTVATHGAVPEGSKVARALARGFREIDRELRIATDGRLDLGTVAAFCFMAAGAAEVTLTRQLSAPPWFNLGWWAFRTFVMFERTPTPTNGRFRAAPVTVLPRRRPRSKPKPATAPAVEPTPA